MEELTHHVTHLLHEVQVGNSAAQEDLFRTLYSVLHQIAENKLRNERQDCLIQPTVLVHEAYLKIFGKGEVPAVADRHHLLRVFSWAMRQVIVDYARRRQAQKRSVKGIRFDENALPDARRCEELITVHELLNYLEKEDQTAAELVTLRFFGGHSMEEAAETLGISLRTAFRLWAFAQARLKQLMEATLSRS